MGWWCSDTAALHFDNVRVPASNLIGEENKGFRAIMLNFNSERLSMAAGAVGYAQACLEDAIAWARERKTFGQPLVEHQAIRHKLVDMQTRVHAARAMLYDTVWKLDAAPRDKGHIAQLAMLKNFTTDTMQFCADAAVQTLGGAGFIRGTRAERVYREAKVMQIGGGSTEIMKDLACAAAGVVVMKKADYIRAGLEHHRKPHPVQQGARPEARVDGPEGAEARVRHAPRARRQFASRDSAWRRDFRRARRDRRLCDHACAGEGTETRRETFVPNMGTIDLRVDYLRPGRGKHFVSTAKVVRLGIELP
jgi:hypothetical protein